MYDRAPAVKGFFFPVASIHNKENSLFIPPPPLPSSLFLPEESRALLLILTDGATHRRRPGVAQIILFPFDFLLFQHVYFFSFSFSKKKPISLVSGGTYVRLRWYVFLMLISACSFLFFPFFSYISNAGKGRRGRKGLLLFTLFRVYSGGPREILVPIKREEA